MSGNASTVQVDVRLGEATVVVGDHHGAENKILITLQNKGSGFNAVVSLSAHSGDAPDAFVIDPLAIRNPTLTRDGKETVMDLARSVENCSAVWSSPIDGLHFEADTEISIALSHFEIRTPPGKTELTVCVSEVKFESDGEPKLEGRQTSTVVIEKTVEDGEGPLIHFLTATPDFVVSGGQDRVHLSFLVSGCDDIRLYRNNQLVLEGDGSPTDGAPSGWTRKLIKTQTGQAILGVLDETPSITTVYRLEVSPPGDAPESTVAPRSVTIQVLSPGWNQIVHGFGYPVRLFVSPDLEGKPGSKLYGIFVRSDGFAQLLATSNGLDGWQLQPGEVPQHMAFSPGTAFDRGLWLIGGSCISDEFKREGISDKFKRWPGPHEYNEAFRYSKLNGTLDWRKVPLTKPRSTDLASFEERTGHAVLNVPGHIVKNDDDTDQREPSRIWIIGGYDSQKGRKSYGEVLTIEREDEEKYALKAPPEERKCVPELERRRHAAAVMKQPGDRISVYVQGGVTSYGIDLDDIIMSEDGKKWELQTSIRPAPGDALASALIALPQPSGFDRLVFAGTFHVPDRQQDGGGGDPPNLIRSSMFEFSS